MRSPCGREPRLPLAADVAVEPSHDFLDDLAVMGAVAGPERGIPVLYESRGREYVVFMSPAQGAGQQGGRTGGARPAPPPTGPYGYIAFALPAR
jgi:hypothetical protein